MPPPPARPQAPRLAAPLGALGLLFLKFKGVGMLLAAVLYYTLKARNFLGFRVRGACMRRRWLAHLPSLKLSALRPAGLGERAA